MKLSQAKFLKFLLATAMSIGFVSCQKNSPSNQITPSSSSTKIESKTSVNATAADTSASSKTLKVQSSPCGVAQLPPPGSDQIIARPGTLLSCLHPNGALLDPSLPDRSVMVNGQYSTNSRTAPPAEIYYGPISSITGRPRFHLVMQSDANLVLYREDVSPKRSIWSTNTATSGANKLINCYVVLQSDGNLVLKVRDKLGNLVEQWASHSLTCASTQLPILVFQSDGNIVELYEAPHIGAYAYAFLGNTGTGGGGNKSNNFGYFR